MNPSDNDHTEAHFIFLSFRSQRTILNNSIRILFSQLLVIRCACLSILFANETKTKTKHSEPQPAILLSRICLCSNSHTLAGEPLFMCSERMAQHNYARPRCLRRRVTLLTHSRKLYSFRQRATAQWMRLVITKRQQRWLYVQRHRVELFYCNEYFGAIIKWEQTLFTPASGVSVALAVRIETPRLFSCFSLLLCLVFYWCLHILLISARFLVRSIWRMSTNCQSTSMII